MKYRLLDYLVCPECGGELSISIFKESRVETAVLHEIKRCSRHCTFRDHKNRPSDSDDECACCMTYEIEAGILSCSCRTVYPVDEGIPRMLPDALDELDSFSETYRNNLISTGALAASQKSEPSLRMQKKTKASFGYQWLRYNANDVLEDHTVFLADSQLSGEAIQNKLVLDAGCGMGRYTAVAAGMGAEIIGLDLSKSVLKAYEKTRPHPFAHIIQADIMRLPFRIGQFDVIYSLGVLHHTPDARQAFLQLTKRLKENGIISVWLYGTAGSFADFKTNPLKTDRAQYFASTLAQQMHWLLVSLRESLYNCLRIITTRMNVPLLYMLCYPLAALGKIPLFKYLTASVHPKWRVRLQENFDWFSPEYQSHHTKEEVLAWFAEARVGVISQLRHGFIPKVGIKGVLRSRL
jgi:SAM-dependent methyltransferase